MRNSLKIVYGFMNLPYHMQLDLLKPFYSPEEWRQHTDIELFTLCFKRAKEQGKIADILLSIEKAVSEHKEYLFDA